MRLWKLTTSAIVCLSMGLCAVIASTSQAGHLIDFESTPGGAACYEGMPIVNEYLSQGVTFGLEGGGAPHMAQLGGSDGAAAFLGPPSHTLYDMVYANQAAGEYFLTDDGVLGIDQPKTLVVTYASPVGIASGLILDVDGTEAWRVEVWDGNQVLIDFFDLNSTTLGAGDGMASSWAFEHAVNDIAQIRLRYTGLSLEYVGFAFDNFDWDLANASHSAIPIPLPPAAWSSLGILVPLAGNYLRKRRQMRSTPTC
jgi:hypothetical protein